MEHREVKSILILTVLIVFGLLLMGLPSLISMGLVATIILAGVGFLVALVSFGYVIYSALTH